MNQDPSSEESRNADVYLSFWDDLLTKTLLPELHRCYLRPNSEARIQITPELWKHRFDECLFLFLCDRVKEFLESVCRKYLLRAGRDMIKYGSLEEVKKFLDRLITLDAQVISKLLTPLAEVFVETNPDSSSPSKAIVTDAFRRRVYFKFADCLREEAFKAISHDLKIQDQDVLTSYFDLLKELGGREQVEFCTEEWDKPLCKRISRTLKESVSKWDCRTLLDLLLNTKALIQDCHNLFLFFRGDVRRLVMKDIGKTRDLLLFKNDSKQFRTFFFDEGTSETLIHLFDLFQGDEDFLCTMASHAFQFYSDLIYGKGKDANHHLFKNEETVKKFLSIWFKLHNFLVAQNMERTAVQEAFVNPFMEFIDHAANYPDTLTKVLNDVFCGLVSRTANGHHTLNQSSLEKLFAFSSLSNFLPSAEPFREALRVFFSKYLLQWSSSDIDISKLSKQNSISHQNDATNGLSMLLEDACDWDMYRTGLNSILGLLQKRYGNTQIDLRFVHRPLWDLEPDVDFRLPANLQAVSDRIVQTFQSTSPTKSASIHSLEGHMIIRSNVWAYNGSPVRIFLSTGQGCVLARVGHQEVSLKELAKQILVNRQEVLGLSALTAILKSFMTEHQLLKKKPENTIFRETDTFSLNMEFQSKSAVIKLPIPELRRERDARSTKTALNHFSALDLGQIVRAAVMGLLKHERKMEMSRVRDMVVERLGALYDLTEVNFEEVLRRLESEEYVTVDKSIVEYIP